jgi:uncharacterized protein affecting Mg2+/Co2+ transport
MECGIIKWPLNWSNVVTDGVCISVKSTYVGWHHADEAIAQHELAYHICIPNEKKQQIQLLWQCLKIQMVKSAHNHVVLKPGVDGPKLPILHTKEGLGYTTLVMHSVKADLKITVQFFLGCQMFCISLMHKEVHSFF